MPLLRQMIRTTMAATLPRRLFLVHGPVDGSSVCLTFDDGPHPENTPRVLDVLQAHNTPATFFVIGENVQQHPDLLRRIAAEGHAIGHHSFLHTDPDATSSRQLLAEIKQTNQLLENLIGRKSSLFRPPHGKLTAAKMLGLWRAGQKIILWNVDPKDFQSHSPEQLRQWFKSHPLSPGDIVLLHDKVEHLAEILPEVIQSTRRRGIHFTTVAKWIA